MFLEKKIGLLVNIRSTQLGFLGFLEQVGCFIRFVKLQDSKKDVIGTSEIPALKSPRKIIYSYYNIKFLLTTSRCLKLLFCGL